MERTKEKINLSKPIDFHQDNTKEFLSEDEYKEIRHLLSKSFKKTLRKKCIYPGCSNKVDSHNHIIPENLIRHYEPEIKKIQFIEKDRYEAIFPPSRGRKLFKSLSITKEPSFSAFCNYCDNKLFKDIDSYRHHAGQVIPDRVLLQMHYRIICNGMICLERERIIVKAFLEYFKTKEWFNQINQYQMFLEQIATSYDLHIEEKSRCELYLNNGRDVPKMERIFLSGGELNPLCFGRIGYYAYQFSYPQEKLLTDFSSNMPYVTFFSIIGKNRESHLVFTTLPENTDHLFVVNKMLDRPDPANELARLIHIFSDGCILRDDYIEKHNEVLSASINYFIENSGLYDVH